ncbi:MAG: hypothetical protein ACRYFU_04615 [Janthinobacterium lividum]
MRSFLPRTMYMVPLLASLASSAASQAQTAASAADLVLKNATVMTVTHGTLPNASVWVHNGKIAGYGVTVSAPASAVIVDATGKFVTPGIIDPHSHLALSNDVNEATSPITPSMMMIDAFTNTDKGLYQALAGGVTSLLLLHGSANMIGGQAVVIKNKFGFDRDAMLFPNAPQSIKFASGENPKRVYGSKGQVPSTRMGNFEVMREAFEDAKHYMAEWDAYNARVTKGEKNLIAPKKDLKLEALADVLRGKLLVQIHCYRADEFLTEEAIAKEYGYKVRAFHHALEMYKVGDKIAPTGTGIATFADWWGFKDEAWDAIPWNAVMSMREGVRVALKSDSNDYVRRLNQEAGKMIHYGGATEDEALRMITLNPAWIMEMTTRSAPSTTARMAIWSSGTWIRFPPTPVRKRFTSMAICSSIAHSPALGRPIFTAS